MYHTEGTEITPGEGRKPDRETLSNRREKTHSFGKETIKEPQGETVSGGTGGASTPSPLSQKKTIFFIIKKKKKKERGREKEKEGLAVFTNSFTSKKKRTLTKQNFEDLVFPQSTN